MEDKEIIGEEIIGFVFPDYPMLKYSNNYKKLEGKTGIVRNINEAHPTYTNVEFKESDGESTFWHYPTELIKKQLMDKTPIDIDELFKQIKSYGI